MTVGIVTASIAYCALLVFAALGRFGPATLAGLRFPAFLLRQDGRRSWTADVIDY